MASLIVRRSRSVALAGVALLALSCGGSDLAPRPAQVPAVAPPQGTLRLWSEDEEWYAESAEGPWPAEPSWAPSLDFAPSLARPDRQPLQRFEGSDTCFPSGIGCKVLLGAPRDTLGVLLAPGEGFDASVERALVRLDQLTGRSGLLYVVEHGSGDARSRALAKHTRRALLARGLSSARVLTRAVPRDPVLPPHVELTVLGVEPTPPSGSTGAPSEWPRLGRTLRPGEGPPTQVCPDLPLVPREHAAWTVDRRVVVTEGGTRGYAWFRDAIVVRNVSRGTSPAVRLVVGQPCEGEGIVPSLCPGGEIHVLCGARRDVVGVFHRSFVTADLSLRDGGATAAETLTLVMEACHAPGLLDFTATLFDTPAGFPPSPRPLQSTITAQCSRHWGVDLTRRREVPAPLGGFRASRAERAEAATPHQKSRSVWLARREALEDTARVGEALIAALAELEKETGIDAAELREAKEGAARMAALARAEAERLGWRLR